MKTTKKTSPGATWQQILKHKVSFTTSDLEQLLYEPENRQELHVALHHKKPHFWKFFR
ncbi:MAG: hypothetical protein WAQ28_09355 [Bacteroidia bacterium]|jgi:hypothetical protein